MTFREQAEFQAGGSLAAKAITDDGDIIFEGLAAPITADDQDEAFEEKALQGAIDEFMGGDRPLLFQHDGRMPLGTVEHLEHRPGVGLWMKARVVKPEPHTPAADIFNKVQRGVIRGISTAGRFWRRPVGAGEGVKSGNPLGEHYRIWKARFREISLTPIPVHPEALGAVAQKAFTDNTDELLPSLSEDERERVYDAVSRFRRMVERYEGLLIASTSDSNPEGEPAL